MALLDDITEVITKRAWKNCRLIDFVVTSRNRGKIAEEFLDKGMLKKLDFLKQKEEKKDLTDVPYS